VAKTNFIATISHELKTPISSIKMSLKLLSDTRIGPLNAEQSKLVEDIKSDSQRLLKITSELLDMTQVETGTIQFNIQSVDPLQIIEQATAAINSLIEEKKVVIEKKIPANLPLIKADADKTTWVLLNFLTNAIRYSNPGARVIISVEPKQNALLFSVQDFGRGIEQKYQARIFEKFFQIPGSIPGGSGIGLTISKEIIEKQGGKVSMQSELGKGSKFSFELGV
jgi:signal transduction histidine kinase